MKIKLFWKPLLWLGIICYGLFVPASDLPLKPFLKIQHFDKMVHFALFFIFCLLLISPFKKIQLKHYILAPLIAILLSGILELSQHILSNSRSSNIYDFLANSTGVLASVLFYYLFVSGRKWEKVF